MAVEDLIANAIQAIRRVEPADRQVLVTLSEAQHEAEPAHGKCAVIDVEDSGPGLTEDVRTSLLRGEAYTSKPGGGDGFRIAREVVSELGGTLDILPRSELLGGAWIRIWLPLCGQSPTSASQT